MGKKLAILFTIFLFLSMCGLAFNLASNPGDRKNRAQTISNTPPSGVVAYVPITITNTQSQNVPSNFQQMLTVHFASYSSYLNQTAENIEFYDSSWTPINSWIETNAFCSTCTSTIWVRLDQSIPANGSINVYLGFLSKLQSQYGQSVGTAPNATASYGYFDTGTNVFNSFYTNFASLPSGWSQGVANGGRVSAINGLNVSTNGSRYSGAVAQSNVVTSAGVFEGLVSSFSNGANSQIMAMVASTQASMSGATLVGYQSDSVGWQNGSSLEIENNNGGTPSVVATSNINPSSSFVIGVYSNSLYVNYNLGATIGGNILGNGNLAVETNSGTTVPSIRYDWMRDRVYPPNGVMPGVTFSSVVDRTTYYNMDSCTQNGCPMNVSCYQPSWDPIAVQGATNSYDSCLLGASRFFNLNPMWMKGEAMQESSLHPATWNWYYPNPPCGQAHSYGLFQITPDCTNYTGTPWFATYSTNGAVPAGYTCWSTSANGGYPPGDSSHPPWVYYTTVNFVCENGGWTGYSPSMVYVVDISQNMADTTFWPGSAYNPAYAIWAASYVYRQHLIPQLPSRDSACSNVQQWYIEQAAYNSGSWNDGCVLTQGQGYNYVSSILNNYGSPWFNSLGEANPYSNFPYADSTNPFYGNGCSVAASGC